MVFRRLSVLGMVFALTAAPALPAEITVIGLAGMAPLMKELGPVFEARSRHTLVPRYGSGEESRRKIEAGEPFDVAVLNPVLMRRFGDQGKIDAETVRELFRNGTGIVARAGAPKPDISTPEALRAAILAASSIAYSPGRASGIHVERVLAQLGIADAMKARTRPIPLPEAVAEAVARGEAEMGFAAMNLLVDVPGTAVVGPFPTALQEYIVFTIGLSRTPRDRDAATTLMRFLQSEAALSVMRRQGLEPL